MRNRIGVGTVARAVAAGSLLLGVAASGRHAEAGPAFATCATAVAAEEKAPCCFTNPSYRGVCQVQPAEDETCASIRSYLNNPMAVDKTYCDNTNIRGDWTQEACTKKQAGTSETTAPTGR
jgi:hypothetical protein